MESHVFPPPPLRATPRCGISSAWIARVPRGVIIAKHARLGPTYYLISKPKERTESDFYFSSRGAILSAPPRKWRVPNTGIYEDGVDHEYRYYGVPGEANGPLNFQYASPHGPKSYVASIERLGGRQAVKGKFFGMAIQSAVCAPYHHASWTVCGNGTLRESTPSC